MVFNANICPADGTIWFGDTDVTKDEEQLTVLSFFVPQNLIAKYLHEKYSKRLVNNLIKEVVQWKSK